MGKNCETRSKERKRRRVERREKKKEERRKKKEETVPIGLYKRNGSTGGWVGLLRVVYLYHHHHHHHHDDRYVCLLNCMPLCLFFFLKHLFSIKLLHTRLAAT